MDDDSLYGVILQDLEIDHQHVELKHPGEQEEIARIRSFGRKAGRELGWKIRTFQTDPRKRSDGMVVVWVVVEESTDEDSARLMERAHLLLSSRRSL